MTNVLGKGSIYNVIVPFVAEGLLGYFPFCRELGQSSWKTSSQVPGKLKLCVLPGARGHCDAKTKLKALVDLSLTRPLWQEVSRM